ncbi:MAG: SprT-like domain-containing protein [Planctomycetia bacterium]
MADLLGRFSVHVRVTRPRRTKLGDHRPPGRGWRTHRISINDDLNPYAFLTTLVHEIAHAAAWERHHLGRRRIMPHGAEWKAAFAEMLAPVVGRGLLPADVEAALARTMLRPAAATCSDRDLALTLARYDPLDPGIIRAEQLAAGTWFRVDDGTVFCAGRVLRTRRLCIEAESGSEYVVHGLTKVRPLNAAEVAALTTRRLD